MAYVVAEPCIRCKYTDCVEVCPVCAFHEGANFLVIDPEECLDCGACAPVCPAKAIFAEQDLPAPWAGYARLNAELAAQWPAIAEKKPPLPGADEWKDRPGKAPLLELEPGR